ncbi:MAG TPA: glycosyltransferase family 2 protein [Bacteroidia bacterium]|nr:glycosyltransferase family 2 protein [Bacteroidia bacterium]
MLYSFIVPIYNDGFLAEAFSVEYEKVFKIFIGKESIEEDVELIFVNDGSSNDSIDYLVKLSKEKKFIKIIDLSRNFGQHIALSCGYKNASGKCVGMLNVDMQEPPSEIPKLLKFMSEKNFDIVYGLSEQRKTSLGNRITSKSFAFVLNFLTKSNMPLNVTTLRIMNRKFVDTYNSLTEKSRYIPGLETWIGFKHGYLPIVHKEREIGKSSYNFKKRLLMAIDSIISFSDYPLRLIAGLGSLIAILGFLMTIFLMISKFFFIDYQAGYTSTISLITFLGGVQIMVIGFASLYIGRILKEVQNRPLYIINERYNF